MPNLFDYFSFLQKKIFNWHPSCLEQENWVRLRIYYQKGNGGSGDPNPRPLTYWLCKPEELLNSLSLHGPMCKIRENTSSLKSYYEG